jgi:hypothetical protein
MYDPIARKVIISRNVQFVENEAWDGSIEKTIRNIDAIGHGDTEDEVVQTPCTNRCTITFTPKTVTQIPTQTTLVRTAGV